MARDPGPVEQCQFLSRQLSGYVCLFGKTLPIQARAFAMCPLTTDGKEPCALVCVQRVSFPKAEGITAKGTFHVWTS